jgi:dipeptidyl aminopeptidase/acylaminoacyl peptidase
MTNKKTVGLLGAMAKASLCTALLLAGATSHAENKKPDAVSFFEYPFMSQVELSPDGKHASFLVHQNGSRAKLGMLDTDTKAFKIIAVFSNADIGGVHWVNNRRLVFSTYESETSEGDRRFYPGLIAINADGSDMRIIIDRDPAPPDTTGSHITVKALPGRTFFLDVDRTDNSEDVFVYQPVDKSDTNSDLRARRLLKVNTKTGRYESFQGAGDFKQWLIDQNGVPRLGETLQDGIKDIYYLDPADSKWRKIASFKAYDGAPFFPKFFGPDGALYVTGSTHGVNALYRFDLAKNEVEHEPILNVKGYDYDIMADEDGMLERQFIFSSKTKKLLGVNYQSDASATFWFDDDMKRIQQEVDKLLPNTDNILSIGREGDTKNILVKAFSDVQPVMFLLYDASTGKLVKISDSNPDINPKQMSMKDMVHYKARDGMDIPAYLTLPRNAGKKNLPMVVLVHGGPGIRGAAWDWDAQVQFLASRGYAVLQPEFRGSMGFGHKHYEAGLKQWGLSMQDDLADAAKWAIDQGYADPNRICIGGSSYGGYATLMGLAKNPELFRCGFEAAGVTDIALRFADSWQSDASAETRNYALPATIGDPVKDAEQFKATSPVYLANRITHPVLMAYGGHDRRVPMAHGEKMREALKPYNNHVEWLMYPEEGHDWAQVGTFVDYWTHVEKFLDANIGKAQ